MLRWACEADFWVLKLNLVFLHFWPAVVILNIYLGRCTSSHIYDNTIGLKRRRIERDSNNHRHTEMIAVAQQHMPLQRVSSFCHEYVQAVKENCSHGMVKVPASNRIKKHRVGGYISTGSFESRPGCFDFFFCSSIALRWVRITIEGGWFQFEFEFEFQLLGLGPSASLLFSLVGNGTLTRYLLRHLRRVLRSWHSYLLLLKINEK